MGLTHEETGIPGAACIREERRRETYRDTHGMRRDRHIRLTLGVTRTEETHITEEAYTHTYEDTYTYEDTNTYEDTYTFEDWHT